MFGSFLYDFECSSFCAGHDTVPGVVQLQSVGGGSALLRAGHATVIIV